MLNVKPTLDWSLSGNLASVPTAGRGGSLAIDTTNWDAIVGIKGRYMFGDPRWSLPFYADLQRELGPKGLSVVAVSIDADDDPVREYFKTPPPFLVLRDPDSSVAERMGVSIMPTSFLLDRSGVTREKLQGFKAEERESIRSRVVELLQAAPR